MPPTLRSPAAPRINFPSAQMRPTDADFVTIGVLGKPGVAEGMLAAIERGSKVNVDLSDKGDYWPWIEMPIDEVRQKMNILPKAAG